MEQTETGLNQTIFLLEHKLNFLRQEYALRKNDKEGVYFLNEAANTERALSEQKKSGRRWADYLRRQCLLALEKVEKNSNNKMDNEFEAGTTEAPVTVVDGDTPVAENVPAEEVVNDGAGTAVSEDSSGDETESDRGDAVAADSDSGEEADSPDDSSV